MNQEVARIIRVDHAGEHGAIRIYTAQKWVAGLFYKDIAPKLNDMLEHEKEHYRTFSELLSRRGIRTCYALPLWSVGGYILGLVTALFGRNAIWICTNAIESTVLHHLDWQLQYLKDTDEEAYEAVLSIKADEEEHQEYGQENSRKSLIYYPIFFIVRYSTKFAIWLSTKL